MKNPIDKSSLGLKSLPKIAPHTLPRWHPNNPTKSKVTQEQSYPKTKFPKGKVIQGQSYQGQSCLKSFPRQNLFNTIILKKLRRQKANLSEYKVDKEQIFLRKLK